MTAKFEFAPGDSYRDSTATITISGGQDIFRLAVNALHWQSEFGEGARGILVELREHLTPDRFDPMARSLLGDQKYEQLAGYFERDDVCCACEQRIKGRAKRWPAGGHRAFCSGCNRVYGRKPVAA
jgi:hypothetical protein